MYCVPESKTASSQWQRFAYSTRAPPPPRAYKELPPRPSIEVAAPPKKRSFLQKLFSTGREDPVPRQLDPPDLARGVEASQRYMATGVVDKRYKSAGRRVTAIICTVPIVIVLGMELYQRRFIGKEMKVRPMDREARQEG